MIEVLTWALFYLFVIDESIYYFYNNYNSIHLHCIIACVSILFDFKFRLEYHLHPQVKRESKKKNGCKTETTEVE